MAFKLKTTALLTTLSLACLAGGAHAAGDKIKVGLPWDPETQMGAQVNTRQLEKILACVELGRSEGAKVAVFSRSGLSALQ